METAKENSPGSEKQPPSGRLAKIVEVLGWVIMASSATIFIISRTTLGGAEDSGSAVTQEPMPFPDDWVALDLESAPNIIAYEPFYNLEMAQSTPPYWPDFGLNTEVNFPPFSGVCLFRADVSPENPRSGDDIIVTIVASVHLSDPYTLPPESSDSSTPQSESSAPEALRSETPKPFDSEPNTPVSFFPCKGIVRAPGLGVEEWEVSASLPLREEETIGTRVMSPIGHGRKAISVESALGDVSITHVKIEAATKTGLPLWAEGWGPVAGFALGYLLLIWRWFIRMFRKWREPPSNTDRSRILDGIRRGK